MVFKGPRERAQASEWEGKDGGDGHTCSEVQEVDTLGAARQDDVELIAGPNLANQCL